MSNTLPRDCRLVQVGLAEVIHFIDYNSGTDYAVYSICDDGVYAYWVTNVLNSGTPRLRIYKKLLSDDSSVSPTLMISENSITVTNAVLEYTKERIVACINNKVYEISTTATSLPTAVYTHPTDNFVYTSITSSGTAIGLNSTKHPLTKRGTFSAEKVPMIKALCKKWGLAWGGEWTRADEMHFEIAVNEAKAAKIILRLSKGKTQGAEQVAQ